MEIKPQQNSNKPNYPALVKAAAITTAAVLATVSCQQQQQQQQVEDNISGGYVICK